MITFSMMLLGWLLADLLWWRWADRRLRSINGRRGVLGRWLLTAFAIAQVACLLQMWIRSIVEDLPRRGNLVWFVSCYLWHLGVLPATILLMFMFRVIRWLRRRRALAAALSSALPKTSPQTVARSALPAGITRRQALGLTAAALPPVVTAVLTGFTTNHLAEFRTRRVELRLPTLPFDLDGVTVAHVSDLHIGQFLPQGMERRVADAVNALATDLVAFTGDLLDISAEKVGPGIDFIHRLDPRYGLVMVQGNHDGMTNADRFEQPVRDAGLPLLSNEASTFRIPGRTTPVQFLGIPWGELKSGRELGRRGRAARLRFRSRSDEATAASIRHVLTLRRPDAFPILLAHHPHDFEPAAEAGLPLTLSGHTHGGQIMLTRNIGAGPLRFRYWTGQYEKKNSRLFVNNGIGNWFPLRINAPAEIVHLTLRRG